MKQQLTQKSCTLFMRAVSVALFCMFIRLNESVEILENNRWIMTSDSNSYYTKSFFKSLFPAKVNRRVLKKAQHVCRS